MVAAARRIPVANPPIGADVKGMLTLAGFITAVGLLIDDNTVGTILAPVVFLMLVYAMWRVPLRYSLMALTFCEFALDNPSDPPYGGFHSPVFPIGQMMLMHLNTMTRDNPLLSWIFFSGSDLVIVNLLIIAYYRRTTGSTIDTAGQVPTPAPLVRLALLSLAGTGFVFLSGMIRGGDFSAALWQVNSVMYLPTIFLLFHVGVRGPQDFGDFAKVILGAAAYKALLAIYLTKTMAPPPGQFKIPYATSHADSILFAGAFVLVLAFLLERVKAARKYSILLIPLLVWGIAANNRRLAWVQVILVFVVIYLVSRDNPVKRKVRKTLLYSSPIILAYVAVGWNGRSNIFKPIHTIRSVVDAKSDGSSMWRELENFNLVTTLRGNPFIGTGYGHGYTEFVFMPQVPYLLEKYVPHNSILGLWAYCGLFGYTTLTLLWGAGVYFSIRAYHFAKEPSHRAAGLVTFGAVLIYLIQCWGDLGLGTWPGVFTVGPAIAIGGKLAVATGAWKTAPDPAAARGGFLARFCN